MKRAKIFLTAITVLAVVGGALAFNVAKNGRYFAHKNVFCGINPTIATSCTSTVNYRTTPDALGVLATTTKPCDPTYFAGTTYYLSTLDANNNPTCTSIIVTGTVYSTINN